MPLKTRPPAWSTKTAYPTIGKLPIREIIKPSHIYEWLRPIWVEKRETANRVRGRIETIVAKNVDVDDADFRNPCRAADQTAAREASKAAQTCRAASSGAIVRRGAALHGLPHLSRRHRGFDALLSNLHGVPHQ